MSNERKLLSAWNDNKYYLILRWRLCLTPVTAIGQFGNNKIKMNRKIRNIFPRGKSFDQFAKDFVALPPDIKT